MKKEGFTLIELLVVVLIIGILAAVALPQYRVAIGKARFMQMVVAGDALKKAEEMFYLANGHYTTNWEELGVDIPGWNVVPTQADIHPSSTRQNTKKNAYLSIFYANVTSEYDYVMARAGKHYHNVPTYLVYLDYENKLPGVRTCRAMDKTEVEEKICKALGGVPMTKPEGTNYSYPVYQLP